MNKMISVCFATLTCLLAGCAADTAEDLTSATEEALSTETVRVTCESQDYRYASCDVDTHGGRIVRGRLVRQLSHAGCDEGTSWGYGRDYVWVDHGCRAVLEVTTRRQHSGGGSIRVESATYGANAGVSYGNATNHVAYTCDGRSVCDYLVSVNELGDPAYGHRKDFDVRWRCDGSPRQAHIDGEANGVHVYLTCQ